MCSYYLPSDSKIGVGYQAHGLAQVLTDLGHHVTMFSPCSRPDGARYAHEYLPITGSLRTFRWARRVAALDLSQFDVLHAHGDDYYRRRQASPVHVRTLHGSCFSEAVHIRGAKAKLRMFLLGLSEIAASLVADETICVSENTRTWYPWVKRVIPNGVDVDLFAPAGDLEADPTILFVGTYGQRKRGKLLMEVFSRDIRPLLPRSQLWMVSEDAPSAHGVTVLGRLSNEELADRFRRAWVFCLPSTYEGFGVPYIEAMASGTPVVATPNPGAREVLGEGQFGVLADDDRLSSELARLLTNSDERRNFARLGLQRSQRYAWIRVAEAYVARYQMLMQRDRVSKLASVRRAALSPRRRATIRRVGALPISRRLGALATWYGTDKGPRGHGYTAHYQQHFGRRRRQKLTLLEIGVGGQNTNSGGPSLRMWRTFFPKARIIGIDLYEKRLPTEKRITVLQGDQSDEAFLEAFAAEHGPFDVIIDDGSHRGDHILATFDALWDHMNTGGMYVIEDLETAYEEEYGGGPPGAPGTSTALLKNLVDGVQGHAGLPVAALHVYSNIAFLEKP